MFGYVKIKPTYKDDETTANNYDEIQMIAKQIIIKGKVQGVYFRASTRAQAKQFGLTGWVKNLPTGDVEMYIEGTQHTIDQMILWAHTGPSHAKVEEVIIKEAQVKRFDSFTILR